MTRRTPFEPRFHVVFQVAHDELAIGIPACLTCSCPLAVCAGASTAAVGQCNPRDISMAFKEIPSPSLTAPFMCTHHCVNRCLGSAKFALQFSIYVCLELHPTASNSGGDGITSGSSVTFLSIALSRFPLTSSIGTPSLLTARMPSKSGETAMMY
jgi:hypothetical protein